MSPRDASSTRSLLRKARTYVGALVVAASLSLAGPLAPAEAASASTATATLASSAVTETSAAEEMLGERLAVEYAGAIGPDDVDTLVAAVLRDLRAADSPEEYLLRTTEAVCRRALTDYLARGVSLPA